MWLMLLTTYVANEVKSQKIEWKKNLRMEKKVNSLYWRLIFLVKINKIKIKCKAQKTVFH